MSDDNHTLPYPDANGEHPTLVVPGAAATQEATEEPKRARKRWPWILLAVVVVLAALVVVGELVARAVVPGMVRATVIEELGLSSDQQLDVDVEGILLPQLIGGTLDTVHLASDSVSLEGVTGAVDVTATGVPVGGGDLAGASGTIRIDEAEFTSLIAETELPVDSVAFEAPNATLSGSFSVFGADVPLSLTFTPGAVDGELELTPVAVTVGGIDIDLDDAGSVFGSLGEGLTQPQQVCIADQLPAGVTLAGLEIVDGAAVIDIDVDGAIATDPTLQAKGVCSR